MSQDRTLSLALPPLTDQSCALFTACRGHFSRCGTFAVWQRDARARGADIASNSAPDRLDRHTAVGGIHQVQHAGLPVMPQRHIQRDAIGGLTQRLRVPVRQRGGTDHGLAALIEHRKLHRVRPLGALNDPRIGNIGPTLRTSRRGQKNQEDP